MQPRFRVAFMRFVAAVLTAGGGLLGVVTWVDRAETIERHELAAHTMARLLEEHVDGTIRTVDVVLLRLADQLRHRDPAVVPGLADDHEAWRRMGAVAGSLPDGSSLWVFDPQGNALLGSTREPPLAPFNVAARPYFQDSLAADGAVVGKPIQSRLGDGWFFTLGRAVRDEAGRPLAVVAAAVSTTYFEGVYESLGISDRAFFAIHQKDGTPILQYPAPPAGDEPAMIVAELPVTAAPVTVTAGLSMSHAMADWRDRLLRNLAITVLGLAGLIGAAGVAYRTMRREAEARQLMAEALDLAECERRRAAAASDGKSRFIAAASHDLRQPLQAVSLFVDILAGSTTGRSRDVAAKAREALDAGRALLDSLLDISMLDAGTQKVSVTDFPLDLVIHGMATEFATQFRAKGLRFRTVPCRLVVRSDRVLLERVVRNLLVNAHRYTAGGGVLLGCRRHGERVRIEVWDTGPGIDEAEQTRIFEEYYQLDRLHEGPVKGLGLGLSIVARIARLLGHGFGVRSRPGQGSMFWIEVPFAPPAAEGATPNGGAAARVGALQG